MRVRHRFPALLLAVFVVGCAENPTAVVEHEDLTSDLIVELTLSSTHVHILSELTYTVSVKNDHGEVIADFDTLRVERKEVGSDTWRGTDLTLQGGAYVGTYTFTSSGEYEIRVSGRRDHDSQMVTMYTMPEMLHTVRAHGDLGPYRVEFESFPGHIHEGSKAVMRFWVMEAEKNADGVRPPITGLTAARIHCLTASNAEEFHAVTEIEPGVYEAEHSFTEAGDFHAGIHLDTGGQNAEASFALHVAHAH